MSRKRIYNDRILTSAEAKRRHDDQACSIDKELDEAFSKINWERRKEAEKSLESWVKTYCLGLLLDDVPPKKGNEILEKMRTAVTSHNNYMIMMARGQGKSSYMESTTLYSIATGIQKYIVIVSNNSRAATGILQDIWRCITEDSVFSNDYPEICKPFQLVNGSVRRRQTYKGKTTDMQKNAGQIVFPRLIDKDGNELPTSGSIITTRGISSGIRGMKKGTLRPTCCLLDDLQTSEIAENPEAVEKLLNTIKKDIMPLGGKQRLSILQTATPIVYDDLTDKIKQDTNWNVQTFPAIINYPKNMKLWDEYFKIFDDENIDEKPHDESLQFYKDNREQMDEGSEVFNPTRYSLKDGHISAIQKLLEIKHVIGESAFASEYQMKPQKYSYSLDIVPKNVISKVIDYNEGVLPEGYQFAVASSDLNLSFCISTTIVGFKADGTAHLIKHIFRKCKVNGCVADAEYNRSVYNLLTEHGKEIKSLGIPLKGWAIDCNGVPFDAVTSFCNNSISQCGLQACGFIGKASHLFNGNVRSRLRNEISRTILCGDAQEQLKSGSGKKYVFWDSDYYREKVQNAFLTGVGLAGSLTLYKGDTEEHRDYAQQICNERLKFKRNRQDGRTEYFWKSSSNHDMLDSTAQAFACAAQFGISSQNFTQVSNKKLIFTSKKKKLLIV